jgi:hypothetical protein
MTKKTQIAVLSALVVVMIVVWYWNFSKPASAPGTQALTENYKPMDVPDPTPHPVEDTRKTEYTKTIRNIFAYYEPPPPPPPTASAKSRPVGPQPEPPPPPPELPPNIKFFGYGTVPGDGAKRAFFTDGEEVFIVGEGETLLGRYRILKVGESNLEFEEVGTGRHGTAPLDEQQAPAA